MKIEVGKTYRTRAGGKATVGKYVPSNTTYVFIGTIFFDRVAWSTSWTEEGRYYGTESSGDDLVSEWTDETTDRAQLAALDASSKFNAAAHVQQKGETLNNGSDDAKAKTRVDVDYWPLKAILNEALEQASKGKGNERHANGRPFDRQPIMEHGRLTGPAGPSFQALKKIGEAQGMLARGEKDAAIRELLGAVVYACAAVQLIKEGSRP